MMPLKIIRSAQTKFKINNSDLLIEKLKKILITSQEELVKKKTNGQ